MPLCAQEQTQEVEVGGRMGNPDMPVEIAVGMMQATVTGWYPLAHGPSGPCSWIAMKQYIFFFSLVVTVLPG